MSEDEDQLHQAIYSLRQKHVAHSASGLQANPVVAFVSDDPAETQVQSVSVQTFYLASLSLQQVTQLRVLIEHLLQVTRAIVEVERALVLGIVRCMPYSEFKKKPMAPAFNPTWPSET